MKISTKRPDYYNFYEGVIYARVIKELILVDHVCRLPGFGIV